MASEIEQYLMSKFQKGLDLNQERRSRILFLSLFQEIKTLLTENSGSNQPTNHSTRKEMLYNLNNALAECQMISEKHCLFRSPKDQIAIIHIGRKLKKIKTELKEAKVSIEPSNGNIQIQQQQQQQQQQPNGSSGDMHIFSPSETPRSVHGFDEDAAVLEKLLLSENGFKAIAIVGGKGVGKTTLAQMIFNSPEVKSHFVPRIWVSMSTFPEDEKDPKEAIVRRMLGSLGVEKKTIDMVSERHGLQGLLCSLHLQLVGKRYLIVLDDARDMMDPWYFELESRPNGGRDWKERFGHGLPKGCGGGRVIVSSRDEELAEYVVGEKNYLHHLLPLADPDSCWAIFKDSVEAGKTRFNPSNVEHLKMELKHRCGGVPLLAKKMGEILGKQLNST